MIWKNIVAKLHVIMPETSIEFTNIFPIYHFEPGANCAAWTDWIYWGWVRNRIIFNVRNAISNDRSLKFYNALNDLHMNGFEMVKLKPQRAHTHNQWIWSLQCCDIFIEFEPQTSIKFQLMRSLHFKWHYFLLHFECFILFHRSSL